LSSLNSGIDKFNEIVNEIFDFIYHEEKIKEFLSVIPGKKDNLINLKFLERVKHSHGRNIGRTLLFDLSVLFYNIYDNRNIPRFLIHDGLFDSLDKSHLIKTYEFFE